MNGRRRPAITVRITGAVILILGASCLLGVPTSLPAHRATAATSTPPPSAVCVLVAPETSPGVPLPTGTPGLPTTANAAVTRQVTVAVATLIACWNDANWQAVVSLVTESYLRSTLGTPDRSTALATLSIITNAGLTGSASLDFVTEVRTLGPGFASAKVTWRHGKSFQQEQWFFVLAGGSWLLDETDSLAPDLSGDAVGIEATVDAVGLHLSRDRLVNPGTVVIHVRNLTGDPTSLAVFRISSAAALRERLSGQTPASPPSESIFAGEVFVVPSEETDLVLVDLPAAVYIVVAGFHGLAGEIQIRDPFVADLAVANP
jgi:hypothetical protein